MVFGLKQKRARLSKTSLGAQFYPGSGTEHSNFWGFSSLICGRYQLNADFFDKLVRF
jgi:hypothetical protein